MKILLIRHGRQNSPLCNVDVPLHEAGRRQAGLLGRRLEMLSVEALYSSDLLRAVETAEIVNERLQIPHHIRSGLREISFGELEGLSDAAIADKFEEFLRERGKMERDISYPGGESAADVVKRALPVMEEILESGLETVAVVTHGGVIRSLLCQYLGMELSRVPLMASHLENCGITELLYRKRDKVMLLERFNDFAHLEAEPGLLRRNWVGKA
ncbi:MAG: histidine phosphatase family protein [Lachnospiraceae bacterium]|nr:histidine phosphatase family protein [Lachnospiraceae bacterium]